MSNPLVSLKKSKKPPLFLPEMSTPTPIPTTSNYNSYYGENLNESCASSSECETSSLLGNFNCGYAAQNLDKSPKKQTTNENSISRFSKPKLLMK